MLGDLMKFTKKTFRHGGSTAIVLPSELIKEFDVKEYSFELGTDKDNKPAIIMSPVNEFDIMENDPDFALFIKAIYKDAMAHPEKLKDGKEVWEGVEELLEGVEIGDDK